MVQKNPQPTYFENVTLLQKSATIVPVFLKANTTWKTGKTIILGSLVSLKPQLECNINSIQKNIKKHKKNIERMERRTRKIRKNT